MTKVIANIKTGQVREIVEENSTNVSFTSYNAKTDKIEYFKTMTIDQAMKIEEKAN